MNSRRFKSNRFTCPFCSFKVATSSQLGQHVTKSHSNPTPILIYNAEELIYPGPTKLLRRHFEEKLKAWEQVHELERLFSLRDRRRDKGKAASRAKSGSLQTRTKASTPKSRKKQ